MVLIKNLFFILILLSSKSAFSKLNYSDTCQKEINIIENRYKEQGYEIVRVGGEASIPDMNDSIQAIGYAMAKADGHIGIDSGFLHMANLYHKPEDIHLYTTGGYKYHKFLSDGSITF